MSLFLIYSFLPLSLTSSSGQVYDMILQPDLDFATSFLRPTGNLAGGLEVIEQNLVAVTEEQNGNTKFFDQEIGVTVEGIGGDVEATIRMEIEEVEEDLGWTRGRVEELMSLREEGSDPCSIYPGCESCTYDLDCIWCETSKSCIQGDKDGPYASFCLEYDYNVCSLVGCARLNSCVSCLATPGCGWCVESHTCQSGSAYDSGSCESTLWLSGARAICPPSQTRGSPEPVDASKPDSLGDVHIDEQELLSLQSRIQQLETQLLDLTTRLNQLISGLPEITDSQAPKSSNVLPQVFYLGDFVDQAATNQSM